MTHTIILSSLCIKPSVKILKNFNFGTEFFKITTKKKFVMIVYFIVYCVNIMSHLQPLWALLICSSDACSAALRSRKEQRRYKVRQRKSHFSQCLISQETGSSCLPFSETADICYELNFQDTRCLSVIEKKRIAGNCEKSIYWFDIFRDFFFLMSFHKLKLKLEVNTLCDLWKDFVKWMSLICT